MPRAAGRRNLSTDEKCDIAVMRRTNGETYRYISEATGIPKSTVLAVA
jgi:hypothetical protein